MAGQQTDLEQLSDSELGDLARQALTALAANGSWSQVADLSGTTKQAAWSRWRTASGA